MFSFFVHRCLSFCPFSIGHCIVCPSLINYGLWLPFWYFKLFLPSFRYAPFEKILNFQTRELYSYIYDNYLRKNLLILIHLSSAFILRDLKSVTMPLPRGFTHLLPGNIVMHLLPPTSNWNNIWTETMKQVWRKGLHWLLFIIFVE